MKVIDGTTNDIQKQVTLDCAIADFDEAIWLNPKNARWFAARGGAHFHKTNYDRAIADFNEAIWLNPKEANFFLVRGRAHMKPASR
jgi:tetratricopeptide (TPR) repeat protein